MLGFYKRSKARNNKALIIQRKHEQAHLLNIINGKSSSSWQDYQLSLQFKFNINLDEPIWYHCKLPPQYQSRHIKELEDCFNSNHFSIDNLQKMWISINKESKNINTYSPTLIYSHKLQTQSKYITSQMSCGNLFSETPFFESVELLPSLHNVAMMNVSHHMEFQDTRTLLIINSESNKLRKALQKQQIKSSHSAL
ncbi:Hypothetical_protein [Hexamita inflata]|uniref:Hypothetical_protein n=1 Tax=Hexamita inflata TaxID=28002 RepID=A0ABP1HQX0_9EUKA